MVCRAAVLLHALFNEMSSLAVTSASVAVDSANLPPSLAVCVNTSCAFAQRRCLASPPINAVAARSPIVAKGVRWQVLQTSHSGRNRLSASRHRRSQWGGVEARRRCTAGPSPPFAHRAARAQGHSPPDTARSTTSPFSPRSGSHQRCLRNDLPPTPGSSTSHCHAQAHACEPCTAADRCCACVLRI